MIRKPFIFPFLKTAVFILGLGFLLTSSFVFGADEVQQDERTVIVTFGDSITAGYKISRPYPRRLAIILGPCAKIVNEGKGGEWTTNGVRRIDKVLAKHHPNYIIIMEGANDVMGGLSASAVKFNLSRMVNKAMAAGAIPIISTITPNTYKKGITSSIPNQYNPKIIALAAEAGIDLVDSYQNVKPRWGSLTLEGLHPNEKGAQVLAEGFAASVSCGSGSGGGGGCFIATAAFGTPMAKQVEVLKQFRDQYLLTNTAGRYFVDNYYKFSPPVAGYIAENSALKSIVRVSLYPLIGFSYVMVNSTTTAKLLFGIAVLTVSVSIMGITLRGKNRAHT